MTEPIEGRAGGNSVKDRLASIPRMSELGRVTEELPQIELPQGHRVIGGITPNLPELGEKKGAGYLTRWLVRKDIANGVVTRNQVTSTVLHEGEEVMREVERTTGNEMVGKIVNGLERSARRWAHGDRSSQIAAEYVYTIKGLAEISTTSPTDTEEEALREYLQQVPDSIRSSVGTRLEGIFNDPESMPKSSYAETDESRKYFRAVYGLMNIKDDVQLSDTFRDLYPHLVIEDERAMDMVYDALQHDESAGEAVKALAAFYGTLSGPPNAPSYVDVASGQMGLGRNEAARLADEHQLPVYRKQMGLGRTVLPTAAVTVDGIAHEITAKLEPRSHTPRELGELFHAQGLLTGTTEIQGMIARVAGGRGNKSFIDRMIAANAAGTTDSPADGLVLSDVAAAVVQGLDLVSLAREPIQGAVRGRAPAKPYSLYLAPEVTPDFAAELHRAKTQLETACVGMNIDAAPEAYEKLDNLSDLLYALQHAAENPKKPLPTASYELLDTVGRPLVATVAGVTQPEGRTAVNWATVPTIVERELEVQDRGKIKAYGIAMHPVQGLFTGELTRADIAGLWHPSISSAAEAVQHIQSGATAPVTVPYFKSLVRTA